MAAFHTYDPSQIVVSVAGKVLTGFAPDAVVTVERMTETWHDENGVDGEVVRIARNDRRGKITVHLMQTSTSNLVLSGLINVDELTGANTFPVLVKDNLGNDLHSAGIAWLSKPATAKYGKEQSSREWEIHCADLRMLLGGSN
jgi:Protein of unknown function (DUF3277)